MLSTASATTKATAHGDFTFAEATDHSTYSLDHSNAVILVSRAHLTDLHSFPTRRSSDLHTINIDITGANDNASIAIDATVTDDRAVTEAGGLANALAGDPSASGKLLVSDVDSGENHFATVSAAAKIGRASCRDRAETTGAGTYARDKSKHDSRVEGR